MVGRKRLLGLASLLATLALAALAGGLAVAWRRATSVRTLTDPDAFELEALAFSRSGDRLAATGTGASTLSATLLFFDLEKGTHRVLGEGSYHALAASPVDDVVAAATGWPREEIQLRSLVDGSLLRTLSCSDAHVEAIAFSPRGDLLAVALGRGPPCLVAVANGAVVHALSDPGLRPSEAAAVTFAPAGDVLATVAPCGLVCLWCARSGALLRAATWIPVGGTLREAPRRLAFSPSGEVLAVASEGEGLMLLSPEGSPKAAIARGRDFGVPFAFSPDGTTVATVRGGTLELRRVSDGVPLETRVVEPRPEFPIRAVAFSPSGDSVATATGGKTYEPGALRRVRRGGAVRLWPLRGPLGSSPR